MIWRLLCTMLGHAWWQPDGVFTPRVCARCGTRWWTGGER